MTPSKRFPAGRTALKVLVGLLGVVISTVLITSAFFRYDLSGDGPLLVPRFSLGHFFAQLPWHLRWLVPFMLLQAALLPLRAFSWQRTLSKPVPYAERYHLIGIGAFVHNVLPGKLGEFFRSFLLSRTQRLPFVQALGSVAVTKLLEFAFLMALVAVSILGPFASAVDRFTGTLRPAVGVCAGLVLLVVVLAHWSQPLAAWLHRRHNHLPRVQTFLNHVHEGLGTARSFRGMAVAWLFSAAPVLSSALAYGLALQGLGIPGGIWAGPVVVGAISLGQSTPGVPAGMGIYYFITSWAARSLGASPEDAAAFSTLTHLGTVLSQAGLGAVSVWVRKIRIADLRRGGALAKEAAAHVAHDAVEPAHA